MMLQSEAGATGAAAAGRFRGRLKALSVADILIFLRGLGRRGRLAFDREEAAISLYLRAGRVVHAASTRDADRLTEILLRSGQIVRAQYDEAMRRAAGGERLGRSLVACGAVSPRGLLEARLRQVRQIALSLFEWDGGDFVFHEDEAPPDEGITVDLDTLDLVVEGIRSLGAPGLFRERIPSPDWVFEPIAPGDRRELVPLEPHEEYVLRLLDGTRTVGEVIATAEFTELETLRVLFLLFSIGCLKMKAQAGVDVEPAGAEDAGALLGRYNSMLGEVHRHLMREVGPITSDLLQKTLRETRGRHAVLFSRAALGGDGTVDADLLRDNLRGLSAARRREALVEGLNELLYSELLVLRRTLGAEHEGRVLRAFREARTRATADLREVDG